MFLSEIKLERVNKFNFFKECIKQGCRTDVHGTTLTSVILKFPISALSLNIAFVSTLERRRTTSLSAVYCLLYIFSAIALAPLFTIYFATLKI